MTSRVKDDRENVCYLCGKWDYLDVHHIFEGSKRQRCDELRLVVHICRDCHNKVHSSKGSDTRDFLHKLGQTIYETEIGTREDFIKDFIKSYL